MTDTRAHAAYDPYVLSPDDVREPPPTFLRAIRKIGPGMILAASIVGTGELIATTHAGARAGFVILWLVIVSCCIKVFVQIELGRHAVSSGETTLGSFSRLPGPGKLFTWWWLFMMLTTQAQTSAMIGGVAYTFFMVFPGLTEGMDRPALPWAIAVVVGTAFLLVRGTYRLIERSMMILVVVFTMLTLACVILLPFNETYAFSANDIASGFAFHIPSDKAVILAAFAMIGITGVGASELISYPYWCIEKGYARNVGPRDESESWLRRVRGWLWVMKIDAWASLVVYTIATIAFFILGAAVLHAGGDRGLPNSLDGMLESLAGMYAPVLGANTARIFIVVGAFSVLFSTLVASTAANARMTTDFLRVNGFVSLRGPEQRFRLVRVICVCLILLAFSLFLLFPKPVLMVTIGGFAQAITLPMIASAAIYLRYRRTDRRVTPGLIWSAFLWLSLIAFAVAAVYGVWSQVQSLK